MGPRANLCNSRYHCYTDASSARVCQAGASKEGTRTARGRASRGGAASAAQQNIQ